MKALKQTSDDMIMELISKTLETRNISEVARLLGVSRQIVYQNFIFRNHAPRFDLVISMLEVLGLEFIIIETNK